MGFSCKGRGVYRSCNGRRVAQTTPPDRSYHSIGPRPKVGDLRTPATPDAQGVVTLTPHEFLDRLAALVTRPRVMQR